MCTSFNLHFLPLTFLITVIQSEKVHVYVLGPSNSAYIQRVDWGV